MMWKYKILLAGLLWCIFWTDGRSQGNAFHFQRELGALSPGWKRVEIPQAMYRHLRTDLQDLRITGITTRGDTIEAPYLIRWPGRQGRILPEALRVINQSRRNGRFYATFQNRTDRAFLNRIMLHFDQPNFDWRVRLEGSRDQREWYTLLEDYRILSVKDAYRDYQFTSLNFPKADFPYYRISIPAAGPIRLEKAYFQQPQAEALVYHSYPIAQQQIRENREQKTTEVELQLATPVPVSRLSLSVKDTVDYYRLLRIEVLTDSSRTDSGWSYYAPYEQREVLRSPGPHIFTFLTERSGRIRLLIENHDNAPLEISDIDISGILPQIITRIDESAEYRLVYSWAEAPQARYDLKQFADKIPTDLPVLTPGPAIRLRQEAERSSPLFANRLWLWVCMILIIGLLGWFSFRMLRNG